MSKTRRAHIAVTIVNILYGANFAIAKTVMPAYIKPLGFIVLRVAVTLVLFSLIALGLKKDPVDRKDLPRLALCGLFGVALNQMFFFKGLSLTFPINGAIIMTTSPILVVIIAAILIREKITWQKALGVLLGASGAVALLTVGKELSFHSDTFLGDILILLNAIFFGIFMVLSKPLLKKYKPLTVIRYCFLFGIVLVTPFGWSEFTAIDWASFTPVVWMGVLYVVIGVTFFAYLLNTVALNTLSPSVVSTYIYVQPLVASSIAMMLGKDKLTAVHLFSAALVFTGVYLVSIAPSKNKALNTEHS